VTVTGDSNVVQAAQASWRRVYRVAMAMLLACLTTLVFVNVAHASEPLPLRQEADGAWTKGDFEDAERLYRILIERGGLDAKEVVVAYVRLGSARAILGKRKESIAAFRAAAVLDAKFAVPPEAGEKAVQYAQVARSDMSKIGPLVFEAQAPEKVDPGSTLAVKTSVDVPHVPMIARVAVIAHVVPKGSKVGAPVDEGKVLKELKNSEPPGASGGTEVTLAPMPSEGGTVLELEVHALDKFDNRLATVTRTVTVRSIAVAVTPPPRKKPGVSFWATPWPYVIGGVALAAGGASAYYFWLRPTDTVTVGTVGVRTR
jgi:hypothetical protein